MTEAGGKGGYLLAPYRVLELAGELTFMCGRLLGDLGADVVVVEPPEGCPARRRGPYYRDERDPEKSLFWLAFNTSKKGITLDVSKVEGQELLRELARSADVFIESCRPGSLAEIGLGFETLSRLNPGLIYTSITPFGQRGPHAQWKGTDLTIQARCGFLYLTGNKDLPPVRISIPMIATKSGIEAATAALFALFWRNQTGDGQRIDVSAQAVGIWQLMSATAYPSLHGTNKTRDGERYSAGFGNARALFPCADGYITFFLASGRVGAPSLTAMANWMESEGKLPESMRAKDWDNWDVNQAARNEGERDQVAILNEAIIAFLATKSKKEIFERALRDKILAAPVNNVEDLVTHPQLIARKFFKDLPHNSIDGDIKFPGHWAIMNSCNAGPRFRAPAKGEHNEEIYCERLGHSKADLHRLRERGVV